MYFALEPEVAGQLGDTTVLDTSVHPPVIQRLEYRFDGWLGDDLLESFPCFIVTERLASELKFANMTGYSLDDVTVSTSEQFDDLYPGRVLPEFCWLKVSGQASIDDFYLGLDNVLYVRERALNLLRKFNLENCIVTPVLAQ